MKVELIGYDGIGLSELIQKGELTVLELVELTIHTNLTSNIEYLSSQNWSLN